MDARESDIVVHRSFTFARSRLLLDAPVRLTAARAVVAEMGSGPLLAALLFRLGEFSANVLLLCGLQWLVDPRILLPMFLLLWYLPAAVHNKSWWAPIRYPLLNFVVDDFSLLGIHPHPRCPRRIYWVAVARVLLMLLLVLLLEIYRSSSPLLPKGFMKWLRNNPAILALSTRRELPRVVRNLWTGIAFTIICCSIAWLVVTVFLLWCPRCRGRPTPFFAPRRDHMVDRIDALASEVQHIVMLEDVRGTGGARRCREALVTLRDERWPHLKLTNAFTTFGPAWAALLHFGTDCVNIFTFVSNGDLIFAALMLFMLWITIGYAWTATERGPHRIYQETKLSFDCGVYTHDLLVILRADKGFQMIPALFMQIYGLPFAATNWTAALSAAASIGATILFVVPFIHNDYDLGIECEGMDSNSVADLFARERGATAGSEPSMHFLARSHMGISLEPIREESDNSFTDFSTRYLPAQGTALSVEPHSSSFETSPDATPVDAASFAIPVDAASASPAVPVGLPPPPATAPQPWATQPPA